MANVTVIIPTYNEEANIGECIKSLEGFAEKVILMDNNSTDRTKEIAEGLGAKVIQSDMTYKERLNTGINLPEVTTAWVMNIDADERMTPESCKELSKVTEKYQNDQKINGVVLRYHFVFMGKLLKHSMSNKMRLFKKGIAYMENVELDEHFVLKQGKAYVMKTCLMHLEYKGIDALTTKLNGFAKRKAKEVVEVQKNNVAVSYEGLARITKIRRFLSYNLYYNLPIRWRAHWYYIYVQYFKLGFLDGTRGKMFNYIFFYWYKMITDAYIKEFQLIESGKLEEADGVIRNKTIEV